jgi:predicted transcriptional regulator
MLEDGSCLTSLQIASATGFDRTKVIADMHALKKRHLVESRGTRPKQYTITTEGYAHIKRAESETKASRIFEAYGCGDALTAMEVEAMTGISLQMVRNVTQRLQAKGLLDIILEEGTRNVSRVITEEGRKLIKKTEVEYIPVDAETTVRRAVRTRSALEMVWGAA